MRALLLVAAVLVACGTPPTAVPSPSTTATAPAGAVSPSATAAPSPSAVSGDQVLVLRVSRTLDASRANVIWPDKGELWTAPLAGGAPRLVLGFDDQLGPATAPQNVLPRQLSPDGRSLVLSTGLPGGRLGLVIVDTRTGARRTLTDEAAYDDVMPAWSPDGATIAFARRNHAQPPVSVDAGLWRVAPDGSGARQLVPPPGFAQVTVVLDWTPDSRMIGFGHAFESVGYRLLDVASGKTVGFEGAFFGGGAWRARRPQFLGLFGSGSYATDLELDVADAPGEKQRALLRSSGTCAEGAAVATIGGPAWRPGRDEFLYQRWEGICGQASGTPPTGVPDRTGLFVADLSGSIGRRLPTAGVPSAAAWTADGTRIVYAVSAGAGAPVPLRVIGADGSGDGAVATLPAQTTDRLQTGIAIVRP